MTRLISRSTLRRTVAGVFVAASAFAVLCVEAEALPVMNANPGDALPDVVTTARTTCWWQGGRRICRTRPVRRVCWWSHGRRVCAWR